MSKKKLLLATSSVAIALICTACSSSAPGGGGGSSSTSGATGSAAQTAAKALGIDLSKCATDPTQPLGASVNVGETLALSGGPATAFAPIGAAVKAQFAEENATDGLKTKFNVVQADDQFAPDKALTATQGLIQQNKVVAMTSTIGTAQVAAVRSLLNEQCVPMISGLSGGADANSPSKFPWTTTWTLPSTVDAKIWAANLAEKFPDGAKVAVFYANDDSGQAYLAAIKKFLAGTKSSIVSSQSVEDTDASAPSSQVTNMKASGATVLMSAPTGAGCLTILKAVAASGWKPTQYMSSTCGSNLFDLAGSAADGVYVNTYIKDPTRAPYNTDPAVLAGVATLKKYAPGTDVTNTSLGGLVYADLFFAAAKAAAASPLGLSRLGLLVAATHLNYQPPLAVPGVKFTLNGLTDQVADEQGELTQYVASSKTFTQIKLYDFEGQMTGIASS